MVRLIVFLFVTLLVCWTSSAQLIPRSPTEKPTANPTFSCGDDPLSCYLNSIIIPFPDTCIEFNLLQLCITGFQCDGIFLAGLPSAYTAPTSIGVGMQGGGTNCHGNYKYGLVSGTASAVITDLDFYEDMLVGREGEYPVSAEITKCNISSINVDVEFSGSVLDDLSAPLEALVKKAVDTILCEKIPEFVAVNVTDFIVDTLDPALEEIVSSTASPIPAYNSDYLNWHDSLISKIHSLVDTVELDPDGHMVECLVQQVPSIVHTYMEDAAKAFFKADTLGGITIDFTELPAGIGALPTITVSAMGLDSAIAVTSLGISGFDSVNEVQILQPMNTSNVTLHTAVGFGYLELDVGLMLLVEDGTGGSYNESVQIRLRITDVELIADTTIAIDEYVLDSFYLDQLTSPGCWLASMQTINIPNLQLKMVVSEFEITEVSGDAGQLEDDIVQFIDNALLLVMDGFGELTSDVINGFAQGPLRAQLNTMLTDSLADRKAEYACLTHIPQDQTTDYIKWYNSSLVRGISDLVSAVGPTGLNSLMNCVTNGTGVLNLNISKLAISIGGLNSFYELAILHPFPSGDVDKEYNLYNQIALGFCPDEENCNPLHIDIASNGYEFQEVVGAAAEDLGAFLGAAFESFKVSMSLENLRLYVDLFWKVDKHAMADLQYGQIDVLGCVPSTYAGLAISNWSLSVTGAEVIVDDGEKMHNATQGINAILGRLTSESKREEKNEEIAENLSKAAEVCADGGVVPNSGDSNNGHGSNGKEQTWKLEMFFLVVGCTLSLAALLWAYHYWGGESKVTADALGSAAANVENGDAKLNVHAVNRLEEMQKPVWDRWDCKNTLFFNEKIPLIIRYGIPIACVGNMACFLNSNLTPDAVSVMVQVLSSQGKSDPQSVFDFGLQNTVQDMWDAKVYPLAILIAFFSGAWPYVKLAFMLCAWVIPPGLLSVQRREYYLQMLDMLGKWSLIDFYVMVMFLCAFYCQLHIGDNLTIDITVLPRWGFYGFLLATMISLGLGHIILACHRLLVDPKIPVQLDESAEKVSLVNYEYKFPLYEDDVTNPDKDLHHIVNHPRSRATSRASRNSSDENEGGSSMAGDDDASSMSDVTNSLKSAQIDPSRKVPFLAVKMTTFGKIMLVVFLLLCMLFVVGGTFKETMAFEFKGLVGLMLGSKYKTNYSYVSIGDNAPRNSGLPSSDFAIHWVQASYFLFGIVMPLGLLVVLLYVWFTPMSISSLREIFVLTEVLNAWNALDVFCVSIAAALMEIQQFAAFIVGDSCDGINKILEQEPFNTLLDGDDKCFDVVATIDTDAWILFSAAVLLLIAGWPSLSVCHFAIKSRMQVISRHMLDSVVGSIIAMPKTLRYSDSLTGGEGGCRATDINNISGASAGVVMNPIGGGGGARACSAEEEYVQRELMAAGLASSSSTTAPPVLSGSAGGTFNSSKAPMSPNDSQYTADSPPPPFSAARAPSSSIGSSPEQQDAAAAHTTALKQMKTDRALSAEEQTAVDMDKAVHSAEEVYEKQSYWHRCTSHNITVWFLLLLGQMRLVSIERVFQTRGLSFSALSKKQQRKARQLLQEGFTNTQAIMPLLTQLSRSLGEEEEEDDDDNEEGNYSGSGSFVPPSTPKHDHDADNPDVAHSEIYDHRSSFGSSPVRTVEAGATSTAAALEA